MKKIFGIFAIMTLLIAVSAPSTYAQVTSDKVTISKSDLTPQQIASIEAQAQVDKANAEVAKLQKKLETYGDWVGVGGEIGSAVKEGLTAVVDVADKFGKTDVGKFTLVMVAWKVMGKDIVQITLGLLFFAVFTSVLIWITKRTLTSKKVLTSNPGPFKYPKTYQVVKSDLDSDGTTIVTIAICIAFLLNIWITHAIMF